MFAPAGTWVLAKITHSAITASISWRIKSANRSLGAVLSVFARVGSVKQSSHVDAVDICLYKFLPKQALSDRFRAKAGTQPPIPLGMTSGMRKVKRVSVEFEVASNAPPWARAISEAM
jgi:hypothetical protein